MLTRRSCAVRCGSQSEIGVQRVVTGAGCPGESGTSQNPVWIAYSEGAEVLNWQWDSVATPTWRELGAEARDLGVQLCIEVHPGTLAFNTDSFLRLREIAGEAVGANFDPSHFLWQGMDPNVVASALTDCIFHAHAKDVATNRYLLARNGVMEHRPLLDREHRAWSFCSFGDGHDAPFWSTVLKSVRTAGYADVWSIEHEDASLDSRTAVRKAAAFLDHIMRDTEEEPPRGIRASWRETGAR